MAGISFGSIVKSKMDLKVVRKDEDGRVLVGKWIEVHEGDVGRVLGIRKRQSSGIFFRVQFSAGVVDVMRHHVLAVHDDIEESLNRNVMRRVDPELRIKDDVDSGGSKDVDY